MLLGYVAVGARDGNADDPRWTLRYLEEWRAKENPVNNGGPCWDFLAHEGQVAADRFACPGCGGPLTLRCVVVNPPATRRILDGLRRATGPPGLDAVGDDRRA